MKDIESYINTALKAGRSDEVIIEGVKCSVGCRKGDCAGCGFYRECAAIILSAKRAQKIRQTTYEIRINAGDD